MNEEKKSGTPETISPVGETPRAERPQAAEPAAAQEPSARPHKPFPTLVDLLVFLGIFLAANFVGMLAALLAGCPWPDLTRLSDGDEAAQIAAQTDLGAFNALSYFVTMACTLAAYLFYRAYRHGPRGIGRFSGRGLNPMLLLWGVLFMFSTSVVLEPLLNALPEVPNVYGRGIWSVVTLVVLAPLFEEVIFRGVLLDSMRARYGVVVAWLLSSLMFGAVHGHPTVIVNAVFMGLILGFVYIASDSLWSTIFLHAINNGIAYMLMAVGLGEGMLVDLIENRTLYLIVYAVAALVFLFSGFMTVRTLRRMRREEQHRGEKNRAAA
ncbi:CPBP family intramembrane glutamic endopeptidase [uncultured Alistipes sp.]|uniref:CPBP family intramembrane glutamic endopeptidase n=1 Tax=uncultured Alistipes sp. TaxID=538949 RepID=UPI00262A4B55|nr:CPBP family intramembrane glutamic endopeptidase [uncultured Alistipes sp.]